jgi:DNA-binding MarR family transcriptional regulator
MTHPTNDLDDTVHQRVRLGILAVLAEAQRADFSFLRDTLALTDGNLSRHLKALEDVGYVRTDRRPHGARKRTWVTATKDGRTALESELTALQELIDRTQRRR